MLEQGEEKPFQVLDFPKVHMQTLSLDLMIAEAKLGTVELVRQLPEALKLAKKAPTEELILAQGTSTTPSRYNAILDRNGVIATALTQHALKQGIDIEVRYNGRVGEMSRRESRDGEEAQNKRSWKNFFKKEKTKPPDAILRVQSKSVPTEQDSADALLGRRGNIKRLEDKIVVLPQSR